jgi:23S rRNA (cytosine1962-C5)-methyltransferase
MHQIKLKKFQDLRLVSGHPWVYSNEIESSSALAKIPAGSLVKVYSGKGDCLGIGYYNFHSLIAVRMLSRNKECKIGGEFFAEKIKAALELRDSFFDLPFYRLIHSEADGLPGLIVDRFDKILVCQITTAGMELLLDNLTEALKLLFPGSAIVLRNDTPSRSLEKLESYTKVIGDLAEEKILIENGIKYYFDPLLGQKTGWFFDQRENRKFVASLCKDKNVLDVYCYGGGFGINAKKAGAKSVTFIDSSKEALEKAALNAKLNDLDEGFIYVEAKAFDQLEKLAKEGNKFDVVVLDPSNIGAMDALQFISARVNVPFKVFIISLSVKCSITPKL